VNESKENKEDNATISQSENKQDELLKNESNEDPGEEDGNQKKKFKTVIN
jgi:hypothetical protein